jgi:hypothetical protein
VNFPLCHYFAEQKESITSDQSTPSKEIHRYAAGANQPKWGRNISIGVPY